MKPNSYKLIILLSLVFVFMINCSYPFSGYRFGPIDYSAGFSVVQEHPENFRDNYVLWGGQVIGITNRSNGSEITVVQIPLDTDSYPMDINQSKGRFIAKNGGFLDPEIYDKKSRITVIGQVTGKETRLVGETQYTYPILDIKQIHVWEGYQISSKPGKNRDYLSGWDAYIEWSLRR